MRHMLTGILFFIQRHMRVLKEGCPLSWDTHRESAHRKAIRGNT